METDDVPTPRGALVPSAPLTNDAPRSDVSSSPPPPKLPALTLQRPSNPYEPGQLPPIAPLHPINFSPFHPEVRRGSITDPSLHASSPVGAFKRNSPNGAEGGGSTTAATVAGTTPPTPGSAVGPLRELPVQQPPSSSGTVPPLYAPSPLSGWHPAIAASSSAWPPSSQPPPLPGQLHSRLPFPARSASISPTSHARPTPSAGDVSSFASYRMGEPVSPRTASPSTTLPSLCSQASLKRADSGGHPPSRPWTPDQANSSGSAGAGSSTDSRIRTPDESAQGGGGRPDDGSRKGNHPASEQRDRLTHQLPQFDFSQRRHSIALGYSLPSSSSLSQGTLPPPPSWPSQSPQVALKRKMSHDRAMHAPLHHSSTSSPTTGSPGASGGGNPSVPSPLAEGGPLKRRGSAFDTKMTSLSLMDSNPPAPHDGSGRTIPPLSARGAPGNGGWLADRRDSTASLWSNASSTGGGYGSTQTSYTTGGGGSGSEFGGGSKSYAPPPSGSATSGFPNAYAWNAPPSGPQQAPTGGLTSFEAPSSGAAQSSSRPGSPTNGHALPRAPVGDAPMTSVKSHSPSSSASPLDAGAPTSSSFAPGHHRGATQGSASSSGSHLAPPPAAGAADSETPYSRSPELRVSHKLAERKRRKEMKELFDELRDQLPADRGMKASKWEILSKAVDYISLIKSSNDAKNREIDQLRRELEATRVGAANGGGRSHHQPPGILAHGGQPHSVEGYAPPPMMLGGPGPPTSAYLSGPYGYHHPPPPPSQQSSVRSSYAPVSDR